MRIRTRTIVARLGYCVIAALLSACGGGGSQEGGPNETSFQQTITQGTRSPTWAPVTEAAAIRFLEQSSFGPTTESIAHVRRLGFDAYIDKQFSLPPSAYAYPLDSDRNEVLRTRFFQNAISGQDQLRQRMAFALAQIFVVSAREVDNKHAIMSYHQMLLQTALGNYHDLLRSVTLHPTMGAYLNMVNNSADGTPNENYAREVMQLFSIGVTKLNLDGSEQLDFRGSPVATYNQEEVEGLARALTGWTYPTRPGETQRVRNLPYFHGSMVPSESLHDRGPKTLLNGVILPAGQTPEKDLSDALSAIFMHPNVGPFISFRLIQHFVTSNPSAPYIQRVSQVFNDNGQGTRGDLKAVIKAILLDPEARRGDDPSYAGVSDGKLKEPVLFITGLLRALEVPSVDYVSFTSSQRMGQNIFAPPSVFSFYAPDYKIQGTELYGPEFQLRNNPSIVHAANFVNSILYGAASDSTVDLRPWIALASDTKSLVDAINLRMFHDSMSEEMRNVIMDAVDSQPAAYTTVRAQTALYLAATSSQYAIQR
jgi:hypothetical protein